MGAGPSAQAGGAVVHHHHLQHQHRRGGRDSVQQVMVKDFDHDDGHGGATRYSPRGGRGLTLEVPVSPALPASSKATPSPAWHTKLIQTEPDGTVVTCVASYLAKRLRQLGIEHAFGVAGDYVCSTLATIVPTVEFVGTCNELNAGYAAYGYATIKGAAAVAVTYAVGDLSLVNSIAACYEEEKFVVVITGYPEVEVLTQRKKVHHCIGSDLMIPFEVFKHVTVAQALIFDAEKAPGQIDSVLKAGLEHRRPVYIGIPRDLAKTPCGSPIGDIRLQRSVPLTRRPVIEEAVGEAMAFIKKARNPILVSDSLVYRHNEGALFMELVERSGIPFVVTGYGKGSVDETHPLFVGLYATWGVPDIRERVESSDCVLVMGSYRTDKNGVAVPSERLIEITEDSVCIGYHKFSPVPMRDFVVELANDLPKRQLPCEHATTRREFHSKGQPYTPDHGAEVTNKRFWDRIAHFLPDESVLIADIGVPLISGEEVILPRKGSFVCMPSYTSIGFSLPAALGISFATKNRERPIFVFTGDGAFQTVCQELSSLIRYQCNPFVFVLDNNGYTLVRYFQDGPFNEVQPWTITDLAKVFGGNAGHDVRTEGDLETALECMAHENSRKAPSLAVVHLGTYDVSEALKASCKRS